MTRRPLAAWVAGLSILVLAPGRAQAQTTQPDLSTLMRSQILDVWLSRTPDGSRILIDPPATDLRTLSPFTLVTQIEQQIGSQLSSLPIGSSSGGFTYSYDAQLGTFTRSTETFGPAFAERAQTLGRGRINIGTSYQHSRYSHLDGSALRDGGITFVLPPGTITDPRFGNVIESALDLDLTSDTTVFFASAGLASRLDVGVAVPYQQVTMNLRSRATIRDFSTQTVSPASRVFANGSKTQDFVSGGRARGIGDIVVRSKLKLTRPGLREFALTTDLRLPTGDANNLLGTGGTEAQVMIVTSYSASRIDPHFNVGYTFADKHSSDQVNYVAGIEVGATSRLTLIADVVGRNFRDTLRLRPSFVQVLSPGDPSRGIPAVTSAAFATVEPQVGTLRSILGTVGLKFNPTRSVLVSAHLMATLDDAGLRRRLTPVLGFDYSF
ncbi:MAG TPA: hypothetical protein VM032_05295 [Vicinamibacterales bacterium]|nr:hypothetical protein [Vicinamibacterales bacterium]